MGVPVNEKSQIGWVLDLSAEVDLLHSILSRQSCEPILQDLTLRCAGISWIGADLKSAINHERH